MTTATCPNCRKPFRPGARFCGRCGSALSPVAPSVSQLAQPGQAVGVTCPRCGALNRAGAKYCGRCRTLLAASAPALVPEQPQEPVSRTTITPMVLAHIALMGCLAISLCSSLSGVFVWERANPTATATVTLTPTPAFTPTPTLTPTPLPKPIIVVPPEIPSPTPDYPDPVVRIATLPSGRFGLYTTIGDPRRRDDDNKKLIFSELGQISYGETSNTRIYVDGSTPIYGSPDGTIVRAMRDENNAKLMDWEYRRVRVSQRLSIVQGASTNRLDTLRIAYELENTDIVAHQVGLRIMIDTLIGANDGVPFSVPGHQGIVNRATDLRDREIPDFIQVLEKADLANPGVVVNITLRGGDATPPERVLITGWFGSSMPWDFIAGAGGVGTPLERTQLMGIKVPDSAVGLFYPIRMLPPGERRQVVAYYGLGGISSRNPSLGLSVSSNRVEEGATFYVLALVSNPHAGQRLSLQLPPEIKLLEGDVAQSIAPEPGASFTTRSWLLRAEAPSPGAEIQVLLEPESIRERQALVITRRPTPTPSPTLLPAVAPTPTPGGVTR